MSFLFQFVAVAANPPGTRVAAAKVGSHERHSAQLHRRDGRWRARDAQFRNAGQSRRVKRAPLDFHVHLFGIGDGGTGCRLSPKQRQHWNVSLLSAETPPPAGQNGRMDQDFVAELTRQLRASLDPRKPCCSRMTRATTPRVDLTLASTNSYVPNEYLFQVIAETIRTCSFPAHRSTRSGEMRWTNSNAAQNAVHGSIKVHPPTQDVDPSETRFRAWLSPACRTPADSDGAHGIGACLAKSPTPRSPIPRPAAPRARRGLHGRRRACRHGQLSRSPARSATTSSGPSSTWPTRFSDALLRHGRARVAVQMADASAPARGAGARPVA